VVEVTDTVFLAHYGITEVAAIGLAGAIYSVALALLLGLVDGVQIVVGRRAGQDEVAEIGRVFNQGLYLLAIAAVGLILVIKLPLPGLTAEIFASAEVHGAVDDYLQIYAFALLFHAANLAYSAFYLGIGRTRVLIGATAVLAATNLVLDYLLIFGHLGLPELGIRGAAIASLTAEAATFAYLTLDVIRRGHTRTYGLLRFGAWNGRLARLVGRISAPVSLEGLVETVRWFLFFLIIEQLGEDALAKATIAYSIYTVLLIPVDAFSETVCSMSSNLIGQGRAGRIGTLLRRTTALTYAALAPLVALTLLAPEALLGVFSPNEAFTGDIEPSLTVVALAALIAVPSAMAYAAVVGTGDTRAILVFQVLISAGVLATAWTFALHLELTLEYVWLAEVLGWGIALALSLAWLRMKRWERLKV
jgi:putative MATE family efflux protein